MSEEVICLSSDEDGNDAKCPSTVDAEDSKLLSIPASNNNKEEDVSKKSSPLPGCSSCSDDEIKKKVIKRIKPQLVLTAEAPIPSKGVFQKLKQICLDRRNDDDTRRILGKLERSYNSLSVIQQNECRKHIEDCADKIAQGISRDIYKLILNLHNKFEHLIQSEPDEAKVIETDDALVEDNKLIEKIENAIQECQSKIKELQEEDVDLDDENSSYIKSDLYKKRLVQLCSKYSKMIGDDDMRKQIHIRKIRKEDVKDPMTGIDLIDQAILKIINLDIAKINRLRYKKTDACMDHIKLPDYSEILECMEKCIKDNNLQLEQNKMEKLAKKAFLAVGNHLKRKRVEETKKFYEFLSDGAEDPATNNKALYKKLKKNKKDGNEKLEAVFKKYTEMQEEDAGVRSTDKSEDDEEDDDSRTLVSNT